MDLTEQAATQIDEEEDSDGATAEDGSVGATPRRRRQGNFPLVSAAVRIGTCISKRCGDSVEAAEEGIEDALSKATMQAVSGKVYYKISMEQPDLHDKGRILALAKGWLTVTREMARVAAKVTAKAAAAVGKEAHRQVKNAPQNAR